MHCIQDILHSNDNDDLLCNASPHLSVHSHNSHTTNGSTPSNQSLHEHQQLTSTFFGQVKKWLNGKENEKKEFGEIMRKIKTQSSFDEISVRARQLFGPRNDFYEQLVLLVSPSHNESGTLFPNTVSLQLPTLTETMHSSNIEINDDMDQTISTTNNLNMLNLVNPPINDKKRKRADEGLITFAANGHSTHTHSNPSKKRKTSNHSTHSTPTHSYKYTTLKNKSNSHTNYLGMDESHHRVQTLNLNSNINEYNNYLIPNVSHTSNASPSTNSSIDTHNTHNSHKKHRKKPHKHKPRNKPKDISANDVVLTELMAGLEEDMGLPIHILATIKQELIKDNPSNFQLFLQALSLCSIGIIKPDQFVNMISPLFAGNKELNQVLNQLRTILHVPLHYFHSTPLYAPFLSDLSTSVKNTNLNLRGTAEQYSHLLPNNRIRPTKMSMLSLSPKKNTTNTNSTSNSGTNSKSMSVSAKYNLAIKHSGCVSYRQNPHYKKNMLCSGQNSFHLSLVNDEYVSRSTGAENNPENDHMANRNKHEIEINEKTHIMTLWEIYIAHNNHAIVCLRRLENRILYLYKEYKKMFIIRDDYSSDERDDKSIHSVVDETDLNFYDSDTYTTATEDLRDSDSDVSVGDCHSTTSEPLRANINEFRPFPRKSVSMAEIPEHKSMMDSNSSHNNDSDGTVMTTRSDMTHLMRIPKPMSKSNKNLKGKKRMRTRKKRNIQKTETDKKYVLSRIYADIDMSVYMDAICWSAVRRLYDEHFMSVKAAFMNNPLCAINIVLPRLESKGKEWEKQHTIAKDVLRDVCTRNSMKALDWQPKYKRLDKTRLSHNELWRELIAAQSVLNPAYMSIIESERQKRSGLKEQQREQFSRVSSPMDGNSTIKPTRFSTEHFEPRCQSNSTINIARKMEQSKHSMGRDMECEDMGQSDSDNDIEMVNFDFRMNVYYNYALRFDLKCNDFESVINLPLTSHEHCWNCVVQYLSTEYTHKKLKEPMLDDIVRFYTNFIFVLFEVDLFHEELFPSKIFENLKYKCDESVFSNVDTNRNEEEFVVKFDTLHKLHRIGVDIEELKFKPVLFDLEHFGENIDLNDCSDDNRMSHHNRLSHIIFVNREIYNVLRLYIHLFQRLQRARDLSCNRWRINCDLTDKDTQETLQEKNEREFYGKLMALIQGQIKESEFDSVVQQLFGPEGYECSNIKYLIKSLCVSIQNILVNKKKRVSADRDNKTWECIKLWHFYYPKWKEIDCNNVPQRIALMRRYYSDIRNVLSETDNIVMIEYFLDSSELGVQFLGENRSDKWDNDFVQTNAMMRWWQTPLTHNSFKHISNMPFLRRRQEKLQKYRLKKQHKNGHNSNSKKSSNYKRVNTCMDNMTMNVFKSASKRGKNKPIKSNKNGNDLFFLMRKQNIEMHSEYTSDDSNLSKSKRKRKRKLKNGHSHMNGHSHSISNHSHASMDTTEDGLSLWYHPNSAMYFQSVNLSKISKRSKPLGKNRISVSKYDKKCKKFNAWHQKRYKEIQRSQNKHAFSSPHINGNHNKNNNVFSHSNNHSNANMMRSHNNSPFQPTNTSTNVINTALNSLMPAQTQQFQSLTQPKPASNSTQTQQLTQLINNQQSLTLNTPNNATNTLNNLLINNIQTPNQYTSTNGNVSVPNTANGQTVYAINTANTTSNITQQIAAAQQAQAQQYYAYQNGNGQVMTTQGSVTNNGTTQYAVTGAGNYPSYAYGQYTVGTTPQGYVAIQQQSVGVPSHGNTSYVMDNRTGSIYAAIPATQAHYATSNGMGVYAVPTTQTQNQYVSIPAGIQQHIVQGANGQNTVVLSTSGNGQQSGGTSVNGVNVTMATPPNIAVSDKAGVNDGNASAMQLPVLNANVRNGQSSNDASNSNNKSDIK